MPKSQKESRIQISEGEQGTHLRRGAGYTSQKGSQVHISEGEPGTHLVSSQIEFSLYQETIYIYIFSYVLKVLELRGHYLSVCPCLRVLVASINSVSVRAVGYLKNSPL